MATEVAAEPIQVTVETTQEKDNTTERETVTEDVISDEEEVEGGLREDRGPRDVIKIRVLEYSKTQDDTDFSYTLEVSYRYHGNSMLSW